MTEYEIITYVKSIEVLFDSKRKAKNYLELIRELDSESIHVLNAIDVTELICEDEVKEWLSVDDSPTTSCIEAHSSADTTEMTTENCTYTKDEFVDEFGTATIDDIMYFSDSTNECPECKSELQHTGGCVSCICGYTKCD